MHRIIISALLVSLLAEPGLATEPPQSVVFASGQTQVPLIELYTSEGCNSCPPADRWLATLDRAPGLWRDFVPVALHVDYWDDIGWPDRFATRAYSDRQRRYAREGGTRVVYTPGVFRDGTEWRGWRAGLGGTNEAARVGALRVETDGDTYTATFEPADTNGKYRLHVAVLGMDLETDVAAGENRGRRLVHDFVVLGMDGVALDRTEDGLLGRGRLPALRQPAERLALAAWVSRDGRQAPVQSVGGFLAD